MGKKVTIQDIANKLGLSRNTVSKVLNGKYTGPNPVKERILQTAIEMEYREYGVIKQSPSFLQEEEVEIKNIMLLSKGDIRESTFFREIISAVQEHIEEINYNLLISIVKEKDIHALRIPTNINPDFIQGIICIEMFDKEYIEKLTNLGIPVVFIDFHHRLGTINGAYDVVMMDNSFHVYQLVQDLLLKGKERIGFVGDYHHCRGFYERWKGFRQAFLELGKENKLEDNIIELNEDGEFTPEWIYHNLKNKETIPEVFICANDCIAIDLMQELRKLDLSVPEDVEVIGFDDSPEAQIVTPTLTTVRIFKEELGIVAVEHLIRRMKHPGRKNQVTYIETEIVVRESTKNQ